MSTARHFLENLDQQLAQVLSGWNLWTTIIAVLTVSVVAYGWLIWEDPDTHPFLLARQSTAAPIRQPGESAVYRSLETPHGYALRSGLDIRDETSPKWSNGRDGDLRDVWKSAVMGMKDKDGKPSGQKGKILTIRGKEEIFEHDLGELSQEINIIGQELRDFKARRVAVYLPNSVELMNTVFAGAFYGFTPVLLPYRQSLETVVEILKQTRADVLIVGAGTIPLADLLDGYADLNHVVWVVQRGSRHLDWNEVPEGVGGKVGVSVWHDLIEEKKPNVTSDLPDGDDGDPTSRKLITVWQKKEDDIGRVIEFTQANLVAGIAAMLSSLPPKQRFSTSDLLLPADSLSNIYPLTVTLGALYSNTSIALNSVAGPGCDMDLSARMVAPTIIVASAETIARYHAKVQEQTRNEWFSSAWHWLQSRTLAAGRMPQGAFINRPVASSTLSSTATPPGKLRLLFVSERAHSDSPPLTSADLSDLRIFTGARVVYALTAPDVAGAVASTNPYDYRRDDDGHAAGAATARGRCSHFGVPMSSLEIRLVDTPEHQTTEEGNPKGEIAVRGPAVVKGEAKLGIIGTFRDDHTLAYV